MVKIFSKLSKSAKTRRIFTDVRLEFVRFRKFLENARIIMNLIGDGHEKIKGDYIFDKHYIVSLVDSILERTGMLAFDAGVLAPQYGPEFYAWHDKHKRFAEAHFLKGERLSREQFTIPDSLSEESDEYLLLSAALNWMEGPLPENAPSIMDFFRQISDKVASAILKRRIIYNVENPLHLTGIDMAQRIALVDLEADPTKQKVQTLTPQDLSCKPLGLMFIGMEEAAKATQPNTSHADLHAIFDQEQISLRFLGAECNLILEATLGGHVASDFIFLYAKNPCCLSELLPDGFRVEETEQGAMAWNYDVQTQTLEKNLVHLGGVLLGK